MGRLTDVIAIATLQPWSLMLVGSQMLIGRENAHMEGRYAFLTARAAATCPSRTYPRFSLFTCSMAGKRQGKLAPAPRALLKAPTSSQRHIVPVEDGSATGTHVYMQP